MPPPPPQDIAVSREATTIVSDTASPNRNQIFPEIQSAALRILPPKESENRAIFFDSPQIIAARGCSKSRLFVTAVTNTG